MDWDFDCFLPSSNMLLRLCKLSFLPSGHFSRARFFVFPFPDFLLFAQISAGAVFQKGISISIMSSPRSSRGPPYSPHSPPDSSRTHTLTDLFGNVSDLAHEDSQQEQSYSPSPEREDPPTPAYIDFNQLQAVERLAELKREADGPALHRARLRSGFYDSVDRDLSPPRTFELPGYVRRVDLPASAAAAADGADADALPPSAARSLEELVNNDQLRRNTFARARSLREVAYLSTAGWKELVERYYSRRYGRQYVQHGLPRSIDWRAFLDGTGPTLAPPHSWFNLLERHVKNLVDVDSQSDEDWLLTVRGPISSHGDGGARWMAPEHPMYMFLRSVRSVHDEPPLSEGLQEEKKWLQRVVDGSRYADIRGTQRMAERYRKDFFYNWDKEHNSGPPRY
jgi:hypothetical protein